jgi:hypothetical protein
MSLRIRKPNSGNSPTRKKKPPKLGPGRRRSGNQVTAGTLRQAGAGVTAGRGVGFGSISLMSARNATPAREASRGVPDAGAASRMPWECTRGRPNPDR